MLKKLQSILLVITMVIGIIPLSTGRSCATTENASMSTLRQKIDTIMLAGAPGKYSDMYTMQHYRSTVWSAESSGYLAAVNSTNSYGYIKGTSSNGICTYCAFTNLVNRFLALHCSAAFVNLSDVLVSLGVTDTPKDQIAYADYMPNNSFYYDVYYHPVQDVLGANWKGTPKTFTFTPEAKPELSYEIKATKLVVSNANMEGQDDEEKRANKRAMIMNLLDAHPEGIYVYFKNANNKRHGFLLTSYSTDGEVVSFSAIDTGNAHETWNSYFPLTSSHIMKSTNYGCSTEDDVIDNIVDIIYLEKKGTYVDIAGTEPNHWKCVTCNGFKITGNGVKKDNGSYSLTANLQYSISGTISGYNVERITADVILNDATQRIVKTSTETFGTENISNRSIKESKLGKEINLGMLGVGNYNLRITVYFTGGKMEYYRAFSVKEGAPIAAPTITNFGIKGAKTNATSGALEITKGAVYELTGTVKGTNISKICFVDNRTNSNPWTTTVAVYSKSINLNKDATFKTAVPFNTFDTGRHCLTIRVFYVDNGTELMVSQELSYTVVAPEKIDPPTCPDFGIKSNGKAVSKDSSGFYLLNKGSGYDVAGTINGKNISTIMVQIIDSMGRVVQTKGETKNSSLTNYNLVKSTINTNIKFGSLDAGIYTMMLEIVYHDGTKNTKFQKSVKFKVQTPTQATTPPTVKITSIKGALTKGKSHNLTGTITSSPKKITKVTEQVISSTNQPCTSLITYTPSSPTNSISIEPTILNANLKFGSLGVGNYYLRYNIYVEGSSTATVVDVPFSVR